jgi:hypothetical protein
MSPFPFIITARCAAPTSRAVVLRVLRVLRGSLSPPPETGDELFLVEAGGILAPTYTRTPAYRVMVRSSPQWNVSALSVRSWL